jgi:hypothetical protein
MTDEEASTIQRTLGRIEAKIETQCDRIEGIETTLNEPEKGLVSTIAVMKAQLSEVRGADSSAKTSKAGAAVAVGGGITAIVTLIVQALIEAFGKK